MVEESFPSSCVEFWNGQTYHCSNLLHKNEQNFRTKVAANWAIINYIHEAPDINSCFTFHNPVSSCFAMNGLLILIKNKLIQLPLPVDAQKLLLKYQNLGFTLVHTIPSISINYILRSYFCWLMRSRNFSNNLIWRKVLFNALKRLLFIPPLTPHT